MELPWDDSSSEEELLAEGDEGGSGAASDSIESSEGEKRGAVDFAAPDFVLRTPMRRSVTATSARGFDSAVPDVARSLSGESPRGRASFSSNSTNISTSKSKRGGLGSTPRGYNMEEVEHSDDSNKVSAATTLHCTAHLVNS